VICVSWYVCHEVMTHISHMCYKCNTYVICVSWLCVTHMWYVCHDFSLFSTISVVICQRRKTLNSNRPEGPPRWKQTSVSKQLWGGFKKLALGKHIDIAFSKRDPWKLRFSRTGTLVFGGGVALCKMWRVYVWLIRNEYAFWGGILAFAVQT